MINTLDQKWHDFGQTNERYDGFTKALSGRIMYEDKDPRKRQ